MTHLSPNSDTLPDLPSELILLALSDLEKVEQDPRYVVDMGQWHLPAKETCLVCLAGSVMAATLGTYPGETAYPTAFSVSVRDKLVALNHFRSGYVWAGCRRLGLETDKQDRFIPDYQEDPAAFKRDMRQLAADLKEAGL